MAKEKKSKPIMKRTFTHFTQIPKSLRERKIYELDLANEWNQNLQKGRKNEIMEECYAWAIWYVKYYWSVLEQKWTARDPSKIFMRESQRLVLKEIMFVLNILVTRKHKCGSDFIQTLINILEKMKITAIDMESTIEPKEKQEEKKENEDEKGGGTKEGMEGEGTISGRADPSDAQSPSSSDKD